MPYKSIKRPILYVIACIKNTPWKLADGRTTLIPAVAAICSADRTEL